MTIDDSTPRWAEITLGNGRVYRGPTYLAGAWVHVQNGDTEWTFTQKAVFSIRWGA